MGSVGFMGRASDFGVWGSGASGIWSWFRAWIMISGEGSGFVESSRV